MIDKDAILWYSRCIPDKNNSPIRVVEAKRQYFATGRGLRLVIDVEVRPGVTLQIDGCMAWRDKRTKGITVVGPRVKYRGAGHHVASKQVVTFSPEMAKQLGAGLESTYGSQIILDPRKFGLSMEDVDLPGSVDIPLDD